MPVYPGLKNSKDAPLILLSAGRRNTMLHLIFEVAHPTKDLFTPLCSTLTMSWLVTSGEWVTQEWGKNKAFKSSFTVSFPCFTFYLVDRESHMYSNENQNRTQTFTSNYYVEPFSPSKELVCNFLGCLSADNIRIHPSLLIHFDSIPLTITLLVYLAHCQKVCFVCHCFNFISYYLTTTISHS